MKAKTTFSDHVVELRNRGMWIAVFAILSSAVAYNYHDDILRVIMAPLKGEKLIYLTPGGGFSFIFLITMYAGLLATIPVFIYHLHAFIKPALPQRAQRSAIKIILASTVLITGGVLYGYFIAIPAALEFLMTFAGDTVTASLTAESYLNFFLAYVAGLALLSLLPLLLMFVHWIKPLKPILLLKSERWVILFAFVAAALITPTPDVVNQAMVAVPVIAIYQLGVIAVLGAVIKEKRLRKREEAKRKETESLIDAPVELLFPAAPVAATEIAPVVTAPVTIEEVPIEIASTAVITPRPMTHQVTPTTPKPPIRRARSLDGFSKSHTPRSAVVVQQRNMHSKRTTIDGMVARPSITQH